MRDLLSLYPVCRVGSWLPAPGSSLLKQRVQCSQDQIRMELASFIFLYMSHSKEDLVPLGNYFPYF